MAAEKSLIVQGRTMQEALQRAAILLHCPIEAIGHEVLGEPASERGNTGRTHYKLRVIPLAPAPELREADDTLSPAAIPYPLEQLATMPSEQFLHILGETIAAQPASNYGTASPNVSLQSPWWISSDVSTTTGPVIYDGDVVITGNVLRGASVRTAGSITVEGDVEAATLEAGQDITILGGMLGTARAQGGITCRFAQGANMVCTASLIVLESAIHSRLTGGEEVEIGDAMVGGSAYARRQVTARIVGSESGTPTQVTAGMNKSLREDAEQVRRQAARLVEKLGVCTQVIQTLSPSEESGAMLPISQRVELWNAMSTKAQINDKLRQLSQTKSRLIARINEDRMALIKISDRVYPPTQIELDDIGMTVKAVTHFATFSKDYETDLLRITPYQ